MLFGGLMLNQQVSAIGASPAYASIANSGSIVSSNSHVLDILAGAINHLLIAFIQFNISAPGAVTMPNLWANNALAMIGGKADNCRVDWKIADGTEGATQTWTFAHSLKSNAFIVRISGANAAPFGASGFGAEDIINDATVDAPSRTPAVPYTLLLTAFFNESSRTSTIGGGVTEVGDGSVLSGNFIAVGHLPLTGLSATGVITDTLNLNTTSKIGYSAIIKPA